MCQERGDTTRPRSFASARRNRWTLTYLSIVTTLLLILMILEANGRL